MIRTSAGALLKTGNDLDELLLPYKIYLSLHHHIDSPDLIKHIRQVGKVFHAR
ncbi:MAG: hypothetical protein Q7J38_09630 [Gallionella sp.]|nr:hypothetical protein [Gallionella sp.]